jgi:hypothetical protein
MRPLSKALGKEPATLNQRIGLNQHTASKTSTL